MQVSCSGISIIQSDTSVNKLLNIWHAKANGQFIMTYNTNRNWQAMSLIFFFCFIKFPSILGEPYRLIFPSGLRWQINTIQAIMLHPPAFCHTITNHLFTQMLTVIIFTKDSSLLNFTLASGRTKEI